ncbi:hypothetical protein L2E82_28768 [Cichorium intybus]|uniref:Uncharacterized protein n=1 Tax=Cichorium intybus TaxID=13427 RepID=A0ACB9CWT0_CICIN|nr:hypothetical protein L2E82_28768 [Cichorium intybus]
MNMLMLLRSDCALEKEEGCIHQLQSKAVKGKEFVVVVVEGGIATPHRRHHPTSRLQPALNCSIEISLPRLSLPRMDTVGFRIEELEMQLSNEKEECKRKFLGQKVVFKDSGNSLVLGFADVVIMDGIHTSVIKFEIPPAPLSVIATAEAYIFAISSPILPPPSTVLTLALLLIFVPAILVQFSFTVIARLHDSYNHDTALLEAAMAPTDEYEDDSEVVKAEDRLSLSVGII